MQNKQHICESFSSLNNIYDSGWNLSFVIQELIIAFLCFLKVNLQNFSVTWNKINSSSNLLISYPSITQTQIKHMLPTSFKFRVNSYIKTVLSKTRENSRLKTRYLKGITTEQLFIISILRDYSEFSLFYSTLKKIKANQTHFFILFSILLDHTLLLQMLM